jgi:hypothetical protein
MAEIEALLNQQIGQHIANPQVLSCELVNGKIQGKFKAANRVYNYLLTRKDLTYYPAGNMDSALFSALYLERFDAVAKRPHFGSANCTYKSYQCGKICLGLRRHCRKNNNDVERVAKIFHLMEQDAKTGQKIYNKAIGQVAEGDRGKVIATAQKMRNSEERGAKARELLEKRKENQKSKKSDLTLDRFQELTDGDLRPNRVTPEMLRLVGKLKDVEEKDATAPWNHQSKKYPELANSDLDDRQIKNVIIAAAKLQEQQAQGNKTVEPKVGFLNYGSGKPEDGKIKLVDYRNKDVNAYVAKLDADGQRKFINDHGKTDPNTYKGKENIKEWDISKLEDGVYEANTRKGIGVRGVEKAYFSVKKGVIDNYYDSQQDAKDALTPKEKRINKTSLSGNSDKQISYAESVRDKAIAKLQSKGLSMDDIQKAINNPQTQTARWWLDNKDTAADKIYNAMTKRKA